MNEINNWAKITHFNIRVYGIWIDREQQILLTDEKMGNLYITKFPGGGLEYGEGIADCLKRECMEELGVNISIGSHIYTTDFFQRSAFKNTDQIISVYYYFTPDSEPDINYKKRPFDFGSSNLESQIFRKLHINQLFEESVSLPIDKIVVRMLKQQITDK